MNRREFLYGSSAMAIVPSCLPSCRGAERASNEAPAARVPIIDVTDLYHPFEDPGDNLDLVHAYAFPQVDLRAVILDVTDAFRLPVANHPILWHDPNGPREPGIIPVTQLNYIFDRQVPYGVSPFSPMRSADDKMLDCPSFQQSGIRLLLDTLEASAEPVEILSFGSTRVIAAAFNRNPHLMRRKVARIHISAGNATSISDRNAPRDDHGLPVNEWNVVLDPRAFVRLLQSDLPIALYPCASDGNAFAYGSHNTFWKFQNLSFVEDLDRRLRNYVIYAIGRMNRPDFLLCLDGDLPVDAASDLLRQRHNVWETAVWLNVTRQGIVRNAEGKYRVAARRQGAARGSSIRTSLDPCEIEVEPDGWFSFKITSGRSNISIFRRDDPATYEAASREAFTSLWLSIQTPRTGPSCFCKH